MAIIKFLRLLQISLVVSALITIQGYRAQEETSAGQSDQNQDSDNAPAQQEEAPKRKLPQYCKEELPTLSVKDVMITAANWDSFKKENELFILGVSDIECPLCCQTEPLLKELQDLFHQDKFLHKGKRIQIARIDTSKKPLFLEKDDITFETVPKVVIVQNGRFWGFDQQYDRTDLLLHQINKLLNPIVNLKTEEDVEKFLDQDTFWTADYETNFFKKSLDVVPRLESHYEKLKVKTRVICFLWDKQEYKEEFKDLKQSAKFLASRDNLRIGFVDNQRLIKKMKSRYQTRMFSSVAMSSLVLKRYDGELVYYDLTSEDHMYSHNWINKNSLKEVDELTNESYRIYELLRQPMFLTFVDFQDPKYSKACYQAVETIKQVAPKFSHIMGFFYVNNTAFYHRKRILGVTWDELPAMAFNMIDSRVISYPRGKSIERDTLFDWFDDILKGKVDVKKTGFDKEIQDTEIQSILLNNTVIATRDNYNDLVQQEGYDTLVFFYTTEVISSPQRNIALQYNLVADAFIKLSMTHTVRVMSYDINKNAFPDGIEFTNDLPQIYFFPAYNKRPPFKKYIGQGVAGPILQFVEKNADIKFKFPVDVSQVGLPRKDVPEEQQEATEQQQQQEQVEQVQQVHNEDL